MEYIKSFRKYKNKMILKEKNKSIFNKIDNRYYYIYRITNIITKKHYYGSRVSNILPSLDIGVKYYSSSTDILFINEQKKYPDKFKYKVLINFDNNGDKIYYESFLHQLYNVSNNASFYNKSNQTPFGFDRTNMVSAIGNDGLVYEITKDEYYNGSYKTFNSGKSLFVNINSCDIELLKTSDVNLDVYRGIAYKKTAVIANNKNIMVSLDEFYANENMRSVNHSSMTMFDKEKNKYRRVSNSEKKENPTRYRHLSKDLISVRDKKGNTMAIHSDDFSDEYVGVSKGFINVKNKEGKSIRITTEEYYKNKNEYYNNFKGKTYCINTKTNKKEWVELDVFYSNEKYVSVNKGKKVAKGKYNPKAIVLDIFNNNGEKMMTINSPVIKNIKSLNLPLQLLGSYKNEGEPILSTKLTQKLATNKGIDKKYFGWYAIKVKKYG